MARCLFPFVLSALLSAAPAPGQTWAGQLFNQSGNPWVLRLCPAPAGQVNAPLMAGLDGALHPEQLTLLQDPGDEVAIPEDTILIFWFRDPPQLQIHDPERVTFDLVDPDGQAGAVGAYWRHRGVHGQSGAEWAAIRPNPYGQFLPHEHYPYRLLIVPP